MFTTEELRYTVGHDYLFVRVTFERKPGENIRVYIPWICGPATIEVIKLKCASHHKVPNNYNDKPDHDGFIFIDDTGHRWFNQFPRASYGQIDDSMNRKVRRVANKWSRDIYWNDLPAWLLNIKECEQEGFQSEVGLTKDQVALLAAHRRDIEKVLDDRYHHKVIYDIKDETGNDGQVFHFPHVSFDPPLNEPTLVTVVPE